MQAISKVGGDITCLHNNTEKYISFSLNQLRFIDSAQFLLASLDRLVSSNKPESFRITNAFYPDKIDLLLRKGVYPYEYIDSWDKLDLLSLPLKEKFYS